jgi:hypothetical protein
LFARVKPSIKIAIFVALLTAYWFYGGFAPARDRSLIRLCHVVDLIFVAGTALALWGGSVPIGTLHPVSLRGIFIALGGLAMVGASVVMVAMKEDRTGTPHWPFDKHGARAQSPTLFLIQNDYA